MSFAWTTGGASAPSSNSFVAAALRRARESVARLQRSAVINIWVDPREYAPGTKNQTLYK